MMQEEQGWKTEEYHGCKIMVRTQMREQETPGLSGHGIEWEYTVSVGDAAAPAPSGTDAAHSVRSDPNVFYSTQVIAEQMGFIKGRELIEHRAPPAHAPGEPGAATP